jgi:hypothetical protein
MGAIEAFGATCRAIQVEELDPRETRVYRR